MAILIEQDRKGFNWFGFLVFIFLLSVIVGGSYYLFFSPTPGIEFVAPTRLKTSSSIAQLNFDPSEVINHPHLKKLRKYGSPQSLGSVGRPNPLITYER